MIFTSPAKSSTLRNFGGDVIYKSLFYLEIYFYILCREGKHTTSTSLGARKNQQNYTNKTFQFTMAWQHINISNLSRWNNKYKTFCIDTKTAFRLLLVPESQAAVCPHKMNAWIRHWAAWVWSGAPDRDTSPSVAPGFGSCTATFAPEICGKVKTPLRQFLADKKKWINDQI